MGLSYYGFAFFVFILVCIAILLSKRLGSSRNAEKPNYEKESRLFKLYQNVEDMMNGFEAYVEESREKIAEEKREITEILEKVRGFEQGIQVDLYEAFEKEKAIAAAKTIEHKPLVIDVSDATVPKSKPQMVYMMQQEGLSNEHIAKELGMSQAEIALILSMRKQ